MKNKIKKLFSGIMENKAIKKIETPPEISTHKDELFFKEIKKSYRSLMVMDKLKRRIQLTSHREGAKKSEPATYKDKVIQYIYDAMYEEVNPGYFWEEFIEKVCDDIEKFNFEKVSSVQQGQSILASSIKTDFFRTVMMKEHVFNNVWSYNRIKHTILKEHRFFALCGSVLHDHGKVEALFKSCNSSKLYSQYQLAHDSRSHVYIMHIKELYMAQYENKRKMFMCDIQNQIDLIDIIANAALMHHSRHNKVESVEFLVQTIDRKAREMEWEYYISKEESVMNKFLGENDAA